MSFNNPNHNEVREQATCYTRMKKHYCKSHHNLAKYKFLKVYKRKPTLDDVNTLFKLFVEDWYDYYIIKPAMDKLWYKALTPIYRKIIPTRVDVYNAACRYVEFITPGSFVECPDRTDYSYNPIYKKRGYTKLSCGDILENQRQGDPVRWIYKNKHSEAFITWVYKNKKHLAKHHKSYQDFSHLAYNGVTDDF